MTMRTREGSRADIGMTVENIIQLPAITVNPPSTIERVLQTIACNAANGVEDATRRQKRVYESNIMPVFRACPFKWPPQQGCVPDACVNSALEPVLFQLLRLITGTGGFITFNRSAAFFRSLILLSSPTKRRL